MRVVAMLLAGSFVAAFLAGCERSAAPKPGPPPLKITFRKSQIPTQGMVAGINNPTTDEEIKVVAVFVHGKSEKEERSYRLDRVIKPLDTISVGWAELDGWKLKAGDKLRIRCEGYTGEITCDVPD